MTHTLAHALRPIECDCGPADITHCVICERRLDFHPENKHLDTCGKRCFVRLCALQRGQR